MKPIQRLLFPAALLLAAGWLALPARAQQVLAAPLAIDQNSLLYHTNVATSNALVGLNWQSYRGVPISNTNGTPVGSDGRGPFGQQSPDTIAAASPQQFRGLSTISGIPVQATTNVNTNLNFYANVPVLNWPHTTSDGTPSGPVLYVLRAAQVGAPYFAQQVSFYFGAVIPPPTTDENGKALAAGDNLVYWLQQPYTNNLTNATPYYWSPNARAVFAVQAGGIDITWQKSTPTNGIPSDTNNYALVGNFYYRLFKVHYLVSGAAIKPPQKMYWTEGGYQQSGHPITIPQDRVSLVNVVYNQNFPKYSIPGDTTTQIPVTNTLWFSQTPPLLIRADNVEGRVFVELLGELNADGVTRRFLGFEIVDVYKEPSPTDVTVNLGDRVPAFQDGSDDSYLDPSPIQNLLQSFYYQQNNANGALPTLWATRETHNLTDFEVHWLIQGVAGLEWPYVFDRYHEVWPSDLTKYVDYIRPAASTPAQAALTPVQLPSAEAPSIAYQDPLDQVRAFLDSSGTFYTMLDAAHPAHRTLLQFNSSANIAFERVFSFLDVDLKSPALFSNSVAVNL
ncbi:MAG TPA: hypothetical protein VHB20_10875, partial [Verrucomicrobiae bacterium]|nr:hypothetical protein [Verrucomicrobiae bacterium]